MELMEPIAVNVVLPSGEQVAQLMVNPEKPIMQMKTQIAGLEGVRSDLNVFDEFSMLGCLGSLVKYDRVRMYFFYFLTNSCLFAQGEKVGTQSQS